VWKQVVLFNEVTQRKVREQASVRYTNEEEDLFERKSEQIDTGDVIGIEAPDAELRKERIPRNKNNRRDEYGRDNITPFFGKIRFRIEATKKGNDKCKDVYAKVKILRFQQASDFLNYCVCDLSRLKVKFLGVYFRGAYKKPNASQPSFECLLWCI
jgi:hypothetical protein